MLHVADVPGLNEAFLSCTTTGCWFDYSDHEEVAATRPLCYSTTQLLYQDAGMPEEQSQEVSLAKCSYKLHMWSAVSSLEEDVTSFLSFPR